MGSFASVNGEIVPLHEARVPVLDNGFVFGDSVYEVLRTARGRLVRVAAHLDRLEGSLARVRMRLPVTREALRAEIVSTGIPRGYMQLLTRPPPAGRRSAGNGLPRRRRRRSCGARWARAP